MKTGLNGIISPRIRFIEGEGGGESFGGQDQGASTNSLGGTVQEQPKENPAWHAHLDKFPDELRPLARETFEEWDKSTQKRFETINQQYAPYKQFQERGYDPERLTAAVGVAELLESDPQGFARLLAQQLGLSIQEAQEVVAEQTQGQSAEGEYDDDPRIAALQEQIEQLTEGLLSREEQEQEARLAEEQQQQIENDFAEIERTFGPMKQTVKNQVLREALRLSYETGQPVSMRDAYDSLDAFVSEVRGVPRPGQLAPQVLSGGNAVPLSPPEKSLGKLTNNETKDYAAQLLTRALVQE